TTPLQTFLEETLPTWDLPEQTRFCQRLAAELGVFVARMHQAGVVHHDFHPGNLLLSIDRISGRLELFLIDLHAVRLGPTLDWRAGRATLVVLNRWFIAGGRRTARLRFWRSYGGFRWPDMPRHAWVERACALERQPWTSNLIFWRHGDARCVTANRHYR